MKIEIKTHLLQKIMQDLELWQSFPPDEQAFSSTAPFSMDTMSANEQLQWVFNPSYVCVAGESPIFTV